jgi:hypothetical protein
VARVVLLCPDLLFGSKLEGGLGAAGHDVRRLGRPEELADAAPDADVLVIDLTADPAERVAAVRALEPGEAPAAPVLGFYSHVEQDVRGMADDAGFDLVVPRSRMAREMAPLVERLCGGAAG